LEIEKSIWKEGIREDASAKGLGPCDRVKERIYTKEEEGVFTVKRRERGSASVCERLAKKRVYLIFQVAPNFTSTFCSKKGWKTKDSTGLSTHKPVDNKK